LCPLAARGRRARCITSALTACLLFLDHKIFELKLIIAGAGFLLATSVIDAIKSAEYFSILF
jgi:hypothetical protein